MPGEFVWSYGSGANGTGDYVTDDVHIGGNTIKNARFGITHSAYGYIIFSRHNANLCFEYSYDKLIFVNY
jgi:hypothetical protein